MPAPSFFPDVKALSVADVMSITGARLHGEGDPARLVTGVRPLDQAGQGDLAFMDNPRYLDQLAGTRAGVLLVSRRYAAKAPGTSVVLECADPQRAYAMCLAAMNPVALKPRSVFEATALSPGSFIHPSARLEQGVVVDPGVVIGPRAEIGAGTVVGAHSVIGPDVKIGRDCSISPNVTVIHALLGNRVILHPGVRIGQDGFGFALGARGHTKVPQVGRVIIQDDVEIGANSAVDRGGLRDTVIGEGTKIDNLVQIAHNVQIGRLCVIVSQTGIAGSAVLEDGVVLGGQVGVIGHVTIGAGAQIAATSNVAGDVPAGARWGGSPARPMREWFREVTLLSQLARRKGPNERTDGQEETSE